MFSSLMYKANQQYDLFFKFIEEYSPSGFKGVDRNDPLILSLEKIMNENNQFLAVFDMIRMTNEFASQGTIPMIGINPDDLTSYHFKEATHPDDLKRHELGLIKLFKMAHELFVAKKGEMLISANLRIRNINGIYSNRLIQCYLFYCPNAYATVYNIHINTDIDWCKKIKPGFHYYLGNDLSYFRYPDEELLLTGSIFSDREFEILKLIHSGLNSEQIAEKLFLSKYTIDTHRRNMLVKTGKDHISSLIYDLESQGLL
jgi:DNA-binding CsgD family transcriptional regulator